MPKILVGTMNGAASPFTIDLFDCLSGSLAIWT